MAQQPMAVVSTSKWASVAIENKKDSDARKKAKEKGLPPPVSQFAKQKPQYQRTGFGGTSRGAGREGGGGGGFGRRQLEIAPVPLKDFSLGQDAKFGKLPALKPGKDARFMSITTPGGAPLCTTLTGGGCFPPTFAVKLNENEQSAPSARVTFTVDDPEERSAMERMHADIVEYAVNNIAMLFPDDYTKYESYEDFVPYVISPVKAKKTGDGDWAQTASASVPLADLESSMFGSTPLLEVFDEETGNKIDYFPDIAGQRWKKMTIEWKFFIVGWKEDRKTKIKSPNFAIYRRLRGKLIVTPDLTIPHLIYPEDAERHETSGCVRPHTKVMPVSQFVYFDKERPERQTVRTGEVTMKDMAQTARVVNATDGGPVVIELNGGGTIPPFFLEPNLQGKLKFSFTVEDPDDEKCLNDVSSQLLALVTDRRSEFLGESDCKDESIYLFVKELLSKKTKNMVKGGFSRAIGLIFDDQNYGTTSRIVDCVGNEIKDPQELRGKKWSTLWFTISSVYIQTEGQMFKIGFSRRFTYMKLAPDSDQYVMPDESHPSSSTTLALPPPLEASSPSVSPSSSSSSSSLALVASSDEGVGTDAANAATKAAPAPPAVRKVPAASLALVATKKAPVSSVIRKGGPPLPLVATKKARVEVKPQSAA